MRRGELLLCFGAVDSPEGEALGAQQQENTGLKHDKNTSSGNSGYCFKDMNVSTGFINLKIPVLLSACHGLTLN